MMNLIRKIADDTRSFPYGIKLIVLVLFLRSFGWGFVDPFFSIFVNDFSDHYLGVGSLISIMNLASLIAMIPLMRLADKMKDTVIIRDAEVLYIFAILFYILAAYTGHILFLIMAFVLNGVALPFMVVGAETYIRKYAKPEKQSKTFAFYTALNYFGWIIGMFIAAFTVQYYGLKLMFLFVLPGSIAGLFVLRHIRERGLRSMIWGLKRYLHNGHDFGVILKDIRNLNKRTFFFLLLAFFDGIIVMFSFIFIPLFALSIDLSLKAVALLMAVMYLPFVFSFIISEFTDRLKRMDLIATGLIIGGLSFILLAFLANQLWVAVLATMTSLSLAIMRPAYNGMLTRLTPRSMLGEITSINNFALRSGYVVGPILSGFIADRYSIQIAFFSIAILAFALAILAIIFKGFEALQTES